MQFCLYKESKQKKQENQSKKMIVQKNREGTSFSST